MAKKKTEEQPKEQRKKIIVKGRREYEVKEEK